MKSSTITKFKDWFIITRIRVLNFIKEHKYISAIVGVFLLSAVIALVVRATDTEISSTSVSVSGDNRGIVSVTTESETEDKTIAPNFSNVIYALGYSLGEGDQKCNTLEDKSSYKVDEVVIEATIPINNNIKWIGSDETTISSITNQDGNSTLKITIPRVNVCSSHTQTFTLQVLNAEKNVEIKPTIKIKGGSNGSYVNVPDSDTFVKIKTSYDKEKALKPMVIPGVARRVNNARDVMFGIVLGVNSESLKNTHLNSSVDITLLATQGISKESITLYTDNTTKFNNNDHDGNYYGINDNSRHFFANGQMPDLTSTSGKISGLVKIDSKDATQGIDNTELVAPVVTLTGPNIVEIEKYPDSSNEKYDDNSKILVNGSNANSYTETIFKDGSEDPVSEIPLNDIGIYTINYTVDGDNGSKTTMVKNVKIVEPSNNTYSLEGEKTIYIKRGDTLKEQGIYKRNGNTATKIDSSKYEITYSNKNDGESDGLTKENITNTIGSYIQTYTVNPEENEPSIGEPEVLTRTIIVTDELPSTTSEKVSVKTANMYSGESLNDHKVIISDTEKECSKDNNCSVKENASKNTFTYVVNNEKTKGYITEITKKINIIPFQYKLSISGISPNFTTNRIEDNFYAIGSYYVTAKSTRAESLTEEFDVNLKAILGSEESSNKVENKVFASGEDTSNVTNRLYVIENSEYVEVKSDNKDQLTGDYYTASMGEEVLLTSTFEYGYDADENINELTAKIPVNGNLIPISYTSSITEDGSSYFGYEITYNGQNLNVIPGYEIKYYDSNNEEITKETFDADKEVVSYIIIKIKTNESSSFTIRPGTIIRLMTKYKVKTFSGTSDVAKNLNDLKFNGSSTFSWNVNKENYTIGSDKDTPYAYKVRTTVGIGRNDDYNTNKDVILDASKNQNYTIYATTDLTSPAMNINSNIFGYNRVSSVPIVFELPSGVNYVYNKNYVLEPQISYKNGKTILTYNYQSVEPNSWIEPIYFDFNVDVSAITGNFEIKVSTGDVSNSNFAITNDVSSIDKYKVKNKNISIVNIEKISYGQYIYDEDGKFISNIDKDDRFDFTTKLHNNLQEQVDDLSVYTVLPYIDTEKLSSFNGTYEIEGLPEKAMCIPKEYASYVTKSDLLNQLDTLWEPCSNYKNANNRYSDFGAFKIDYDKIDANSNLETKIKVYTIGNQPDDVYTFKSYLKYKNSDYISFEDVDVEVISKKITGVVWEDFNVDGIMDDTEKKISNVTLKLYNSLDELIQTTTPDEKGEYTFSGILTGDYYVVAAFNTDKYGVTGNPSEDFYDKTRLSVFKPVPITSEQQDLYEERENADDVVAEDTEPMSIVKTDMISIGNETRIVRNINLGLSLRKIFGIKVNKYINKVDVTNALGVVTTKNYGNTKLAKLDVKDVNNLHIKVVYTIEVENVKYYPGYVTLITDIVPDGMNFNSKYSENNGWELLEDGTLINRTLANTIINEGEKKYLTIAFDITRKEAGSFINFASVDELQILGGISDEK